MPKLNTRESPPKWEALEDLPKLLNEEGLLGVGVVAGVDNVEALRAAWGGKLLVGIDPFKNKLKLPKPFKLFRMKSVDAAAALEEAEQREIILGLNKTEAAVGFDFVVLDTPVANATDVDAWWPLIKVGGFLVVKFGAPDAEHVSFTHANKELAPTAKPYWLVVKA